MARLAALHHRRQPDQRERSRPLARVLGLAVTSPMPEAPGCCHHSIGTGFLLATSDARLAPLKPNCAQTTFSKPAYAVTAAANPTMTGARYQPKVGSTNVPVAGARGPKEGHLRAGKGLVRRAC